MTCVAGTGLVSGSGMRLGLWGIQRNIPRHRNGVPPYGQPQWVLSIARFPVATALFQVIGEYAEKSVESMEYETPCSDNKDERLSSATPSYLAMIPV